MKWVDHVLSLTKEAESPMQYQKWAALSAISAVLRKNVWINRLGLYKLYPNIYVFLIGPSGVRKGFPIWLARTLVEAQDVTRVVSGRISIQGLVKDLSKAKSLPTGRVVKDAQAFLASGEFGSFLINDSAAIHIMTDLFNTHEHESGWTNTLAGDEERVLLSPCITMITASNEINLSESLPKIAHGGGFVARSFMVFAATKGKVSDLLSDDDNIPPGIDLSGPGKYLGQIAKLHGVFKSTKEAQEEANKWHRSFEDEIKDVEDKTGTLNRLHDQVLKITMAVALAERPELVIEKKHFEEALALAKECVPGMRRVTMAGDTPVANQINFVLRFLMKHGNETTRKSILKAGWPTLDCFDLDRVIEHLVQADFMKVKKNGKDLIYTLKPEAVEELLGNV